jgi:DNA-binding NarL/FixJ family response regulator
MRTATGIEENLHRQKKNRRDGPRQSEGNASHPQVLDLLVQGCSNTEIAGQLSISPRTVKQHLRTLFLRAGIRNGRKRVRLATATFEKAELKS